MILLRKVQPERQRVVFLPADRAKVLHTGVRNEAELFRDAQHAGVARPRLRIHAARAVRSLIVDKLFERFCADAAAARVALRDVDADGGDLFRVFDVIEIEVAADPTDVPAVQLDFELPARRVLRQRFDTLEVFRPAFALRFRRRFLILPRRVPVHPFGLRGEPPHVVLDIRFDHVTKYDHAVSLPVRAVHDRGVDFLGNHRRPDFRKQIFGDRAGPRIRFARLP